MPAPNDLIRNLQALPNDTDQEAIQKALSEIHGESDLSTTLDALYLRQLKMGYITRQKLEEIERLVFPDPEYGIDFRIQINYARSNYRPQNPKKNKVGCPLCRENVGIPGKEMLRLYDFAIQGHPFFAQLTPFPLFDRHFVLITSEHTPQNINDRSVQDMFGFLELAPEYTVCSNSDVEWAGSSILSHSHYQVFHRLRLPVMDARSGRLSRRLGTCRVSQLDYPLTALGVQGDSQSVQAISTQIINVWKSAADGNTVNLVLTKSGPEYRFNIMLRNPNYRTPAHLQEIKSEGVGVIEASGEGIIPVPEGPNADELWTRIRDSGLQVMKDLLRGNSPNVSDNKISALLAML